MPEIAPQGPLKFQIREHNPGNISADSKRE